MILSRSDIKDLTGYVRASAQVRWLRTHGWKFVVNRYGPVVAFAERVRKLGPPQQPPLPDVLPIDSIRSLPRDIPSRQGGGIYFLWHGEDLHYIGQTKWFGRRIGDHEYQGRIPFDRVTFMVCAELHRETLEGAYIRAYRPPYNRKMIGDATYLMELSGCKQRASVARWCKKNGIKYFRNALGWPVTTPAALDRALIHGIESGPDWSACDNKKVDSAKGCPLRRTGDGITSIAASG